MSSPYLGKSDAQWKSITEQLIADHPLDPDEIVDVVSTAWRAIFESRLGGKFLIGRDIFPKPQIMGFLLHELIPLELANRYPEIWRPEKSKIDKDLVFIPDDSKSIEIKTSSSAGSIFGNRSYAQPSQPGAKLKDGYYLAVNFGKFAAGGNPILSSIRFGWLDHTDWQAQKSETGQQARLSPMVEQNKLLTLFRA